MAGKLRQASNPSLTLGALINKNRGCCGRVDREK
jgi:hypothetical protein